MRLLLDTPAILWAMLRPAALSPTAAATIENPGNVILVSVASAWEIATKVRIGNLPGAEVLEENFPDLIDRAGYTMLAIDAACALRAGRMVGEHRFPFGRVIAAQALAEDIPVISVDAKLDFFGIRRIW